MSVNSLRSRYFSKLKSNFFVLFSNAIITLIVPRSLGPILFGIFDFVTEYFYNILTFFQLGTQQAFYTKLSKNQNDNKIIKFYSAFILLTIFFTTVFLSIIYLFSIEHIFFPEMQKKYINSGLFFAILSLIIANLKLVNDATGITKQTENWIVVQKSLGVVIILILYYFFSITLEIYFLYHYFLMIFLLICWLRVIRKNNRRLLSGVLNYEDVKSYFQRFYKFSAPLFIYSLISLVCDIGDRWLLQMFSGSIEQGYFGFAFRVSAICFIFTSAMTPLIVREFSIAYKNKNIELLKNLFRNNIPLLYFVGAYFSLFFVFNSKYFIRIIGGDEYILGSTAFVIMAFYPIQQSYGQLSTSLFYATNQTVLYRNIAVSVSLIGLLTSFILLAPTSYGGLNLGSTGLAIKKVLIQFLGVSFGLYFNMKYLKLSFKKYMGHKILVVLLLSILAYSSNLIISFFISSKYLFIFFSGLLYTILTLLLVIIFPIIIVRDRITIYKQINQMFKK